MSNLLRYLGIETEKDFKDWCKKNHPDVISDTTVEQFQEVSCDFRNKDTASCSPNTYAQSSLCRFLGIKSEKDILSFNQGAIDASKFDILRSEIHSFDPDFKLILMNFISLSLQDDEPECVTYKRMSKKLTSRYVPLQNAKFYSYEEDRVISIVTNGTSLQHPTANIIATCLQYDMDDDGRTICLIFDSLTPFDIIQTLISNSDHPYKARFRIVLMKTDTDDSAIKS